MNNFKQNIINIYKEDGHDWLNNLPDLVKKISDRWGLSDLKPFDNLSYHYVLSGYQKKEPVVLKLYPKNDLLEKEVLALEAFAGFGAVKILNKAEGALLLEQAIPGNSLKDHFPQKDREATEIICNIISRLHLAPIPKNNNFTPIETLLKPIDKNWHEIPAEYLTKARTLKKELLKTSDTPSLLHGDLHHENILADKNKWVVIDPKGFIGEEAFEPAAFIRNPIPELLKASNPAKIILERINLSADLLSLDKERIKSWCFVQAILSHIWCLEDKISSRYFSDLANTMAKDKIF